MMFNKSALIRFTYVVIAAVAVLSVDIYFSKVYILKFAVILLV